VFVDGEFAFGLDEVDLLYYKLSEGSDISHERFEYLLDQVVFTRASQKALDFLSHRPRTVNEVEKKLSEDYNRDIVARVMDMLHEYRYVDDASYAEEYAKERVNAGYGFRKIEWELRERGVDQCFIDPALEEVSSLQRQSALAAFKARYGNKSGMDAKEKAGAFNYLLRRGFDRETISDVFHES